MFRRIFFVCPHILYGIHTERALHMHFPELMLLAAGLSMDAAAVSLTNGLHFPRMRTGWILADGLCFGLMQGIMPLLGFLLGGLLLPQAAVYDRWLALMVLCFLGAGMMLQSRRPAEDAPRRMTAGTLMLQGLATSIDAMGVGVTLAAFRGMHILPAVSVIAAVTAALSILGVLLGKRFGGMLGQKAELLGGIILIVLALKIFFCG